MSKRTRKRASFLGPLVYLDVMILIIILTIKSLVRAMSIVLTMNIEYALLRFLFVYDICIWTIRRNKYVFPYLRYPVLDLGCGGGTFALWFKNLKHFIGIDMNGEHLKAFKLRGGEPILADMRHLPVRIEKFGTIIAFQTIEHVSRSDSLKKIGRAHV